LRRLIGDSVARAALLPVMAAARAQLRERWV